MPAFGAISADMQKMLIPPMIYAVIADAA